MNVIGIVGNNVIGKSELADYLCLQHGIRLLWLGDMAREMAEKADGPELRYDPSGQRVADHGESHFMVRVIEAIEEGQSETIAVAGFKSVANISALKERFGPDFIVVGVTGETGSLSRRQQPEGNNECLDTYELFKQQEKTPLDRQALDEITSYIDITLDNAGSQRAFHEQIEAKLISKLGQEM